MLVTCRNIYEFVRINRKILLHTSKIKRRLKVKDFFFYIVIRIGQKIFITILKISDCVIIFPLNNEAQH